MPRYIYRYQVFIDGKATTYCASTWDPRFMEILRAEGSCTRYAEHLPKRTTCVKPRNVLTLPDEYWPPYPRYDRYTPRADLDSYYTRLAVFIQSFAIIPWSVDLSTVNPNDYPELFI
jgi:hypothetical protein